MKVLFVFPSIEAGGAEKASIYMANYFAASGIVVSMFVFNKSDHYISIINENILVEYSNNIYSIFNLIKRIINPLKSYILFPFKLIKFVLKEQQADSVVSIHEYFGEWAVISLFISDKLLRKKRKYYSIVQASLYEQKVAHFNGLNRIVFHFVNFIRGKVFTKVFCVSDTIYSQVNARRKLVIHNPINLKLINKNLTNKNLTNELEQFITDKEYVINVARISEQKNLLLFLQVVNELKKIFNLKFVIIGEVTTLSYYEKLQDFIGKNRLNDIVKIFPPIKNPYFLIKNAKFCLFTSVYEGMPLALLETMYLETPIISTKFVGYETFLNNENSILAENGNLGNLINKIKSFQNGNYDVVKLISNAKNDIMTYDIDVIGKRYLDEICK